MLSRRLLRIKALKALYAHLQCDGDNLIASQKKLFESIDKSYDLYFLLLKLPVLMADMERKRQRVAKEKHLATYEDLNPNTRFVDSPLVHLLSTSDSVNDYISSRKLAWGDNDELVKSLFAQLSESEKFKSYMASDSSSIKDDIELMEYFYVEILQNNEEVESVIEERSILMSGDLRFVLPLVIRTLSGIKPSHTNVKVVKKFKNDDDMNFVKELFQKALVNYGEYQKYIERFTSNWDLERIVYIDSLIMVVAMSEFIGFSDIPTKVTMDEFIEISKDYSTASSSLFVNGILDKVLGSLQDDGRINKSGRGLM
ncbi:MAG: transcription antitermination protein NusB [Rikenellaceae bacterium]